MTKAKKLQKQKNYWNLLKVSLSICLIALLLSVTSSHATQKNKLRAPWSKKKSSKQKVFEYKTSVPKVVFDSYIGFFQKFISPVDGPRCPFYPTCSHYGREAVRKHGAFLGFIMSADRLLRDSGANPQDYQLTRKFNRIFYYDPLDANDFWLSKNAR